eukprot:403376591
MESLNQQSQSQNIDLILDKAYGCIMGALLGDASGTYLEFSSKLIDDKSVKLSMSMPGGGPHKTAPGQISDDGELTISLLNGLIKSTKSPDLPGSGMLNLKEHVRMYGKWIQSKPFDIGATIRASFFKCDINNPNPERVIKSATKGKSATSQSNGSLMRITPLAVWCRNLIDEDVIKAAKLDTSLSHSNIVAQEASALYCLAIKRIFQNVSNRQDIYQEIKQIAKSTCSNDIQSWFELIDIFQKESFPPTDFSVKKAGGWLRHAFANFAIGRRHRYKCLYSRWYDWMY